MTDAPKKESIIARFLNPQDKERDVKLLVFVVGTTATIYWLTKEQIRGAITQQWVDALKWFLASISLGGAGWAFVDKWKPKPDSDRPQDGGSQ
jgi:hypothetical protein